MRFQLDGASEEPLYNIGIVSRMTGIPVATLRVWERRYGFPQSIRTPGGHRLCSEKEVVRLRWVKARVDQGMQTGQAIRALQHMEAEGRISEGVVTTTSNLSISDPTLPVFRQRLTELLTSNDLAASDQLLADVISMYPVEDLILEVVGPTLHDIGQAWFDGRITVATEHLATSFLRQRLLVWMSTGPIPYAGVPPIILACAPSEWHEGSLLMFGVLMRRRRWPIAYLGQNVPLNDLGMLARQINSPAVVFVAMLEESAASLVEWPLHIHGSQRGRPIVGYGGRVFSQNPQWRERVPGMFLGETLREGAQILDDALQQLVIPTS